MSGAYFANSNGFADVLSCSLDNPLPFLLVFSLSETFCCNDQRTHDAVAASGIIFGRVEEGRALVKMEDNGTPEQVAKKVAEWPVAEGGPSARWVVLTQSADPVILAINNFDGKEIQVSSYDVPPIQQSEIIDDCGAGDCCMGGFLAGVICDHEKNQGGNTFPDASCIPKGVEAGLEMARRNLQCVGNEFLHPNKVGSADLSDEKKMKPCCTVF